MNGGQAVCTKCGYVAVSQSTQEAFDTVRSQLAEQREQLIKLVEIIHLDHTRDPFERCRAHACRLAQRVLKDPHA